MGKIAELHGIGVYFVNTIHNIHYSYYLALSQLFSHTDTVSVDKAN